jgi:hypothetical protein
MLHGEQFMSVLHFGLTVLTPIVAMLVLNGKPVLRYVVIGAAITLIIGGASVFTAYQGQGLDANATLTSRSLLQGQVWYVVDNDSGLFTPPPAGGQLAFTRFVRSLLVSSAPSFDNDSAISGLRDVMVAYGVPTLIRTYVKDNISFTMGQMAVPVFWFGLVGGAVFVAFTGVLYGALCALQIALAMRGGVVMLWLIVKVLSYASFGIQQGEYWSFFGVRALFYIALTILWWVLVDSPSMAQKMKQAVQT